MRQAFRGSLSRRVRAEALLWSPAALAACFLVAFLVKLPSLIDRVYWDSDAATAATFAEVAGHGTIAIDRYGYYPFLLLAALAPARCRSIASCGRASPMPSPSHRSRRSRG